MMESEHREYSEVKGQGWDAEDTEDRASFGRDIKDSFLGGEGRKVRSESRQGSVKASGCNTWGVPGNTRRWL